MKNAFEVKTDFFGLVSDMNYLPQIYILICSKILTYSFLMVVCYVFQCVHINCNIKKLKTNNSEDRKVKVERT